GSALVGRLAGAASWIGWRAAHAAALAIVVAASVLAIPGLDVPSEPGAAAAAVLTLAFGAAGVAKLARPRTWRRALRSYRLRLPLERLAGAVVPFVELSLAALPLLGLTSTAGLVSLVALGAFSAAILAARMRVGRRLDCGCFGTAQVRDYRWLLARNGLLAVVAALAWRAGVDVPIGRSLGIPSGADLIPATLVAAGIGLAIWLGVRATAVVRRGASR
ncbi:MAG: MauE/DoxX family redox-associated membrane protein, partial [Actinomycetota bacterium]